MTLSFSINTGYELDVGWRFYLTQEKFSIIEESEVQYESLFHLIVVSKIDLFIQFWKSFQNSVDFSISVPTNSSLSSFINSCGLQYILIVRAGIRLPQIEY